MILLDDIFIYMNEKMPFGAREMVCVNPDGTYTIMINGNLSKTDQVRAFWHAIHHIERNDFERVEINGIQPIEYQAHKKEDST